MKKYPIFFALLLATVVACAQAPKAINYQALARDNVGNVLSNQLLTVRIAVGHSANSTIDFYTEIHEVRTDPFGLFNLSIGRGKAVLGEYNAVPWESGNKWVKIEISKDAGRSFDFIGATELLSVPFAIYAASAGSVTDDGSVNHRGGTNWLLGGNAGTNSTIQYLGTQDNEDIVFRTNGISRMKVSQDGNLEFFPGSDYYVGPNSYAFRFSQSPNFGLKFNSNLSRYEFTDQNGNRLFSADAIGNTWIKRNLEVLGNLEFGANGDYLVGANRYAFRYVDFPNFGLFFNANDVQYQFLNANANRVFSVGANSGDAWFKGDMEILGTFYGDGSGLTNLPPGPDDDATNELQALSISNDTLYLSDGNEVYLGGITGVNQSSSFYLTGRRTNQFSPRVLEWGDILDIGTYEIWRSTNPFWSVSPDFSYDPTGDVFVWEPIDTLTASETIFTDLEVLSLGQGQELGYYLIATDGTGIERRSEVIYFRNTTTSIADGDFGTGSDGNYNASTLQRGGVYNYQDFTISSNVDFQGFGLTVIFVDGDLTFDPGSVLNLEPEDISNQGTGFVGYTSQVDTMTVHSNFINVGVWAGSGGQGGTGGLGIHCNSGSCTGSPLTGVAGTINGDEDSCPQGRNGRNCTGGANGGTKGSCTGGSLSVNGQRYFVGGMGAGGNGGDGCGTTPGYDGGNGGSAGIPQFQSSVVFVCSGDVSFPPSATINAQGANGNPGNPGFDAPTAPPNTNYGGGGGGGGGSGGGDGAKVFVFYQGNYVNGGGQFNGNGGSSGIGGIGGRNGNGGPPSPDQTGRTGSPGQPGFLQLIQL